MDKTFNYGTGHLTIGTCLDIASGKVKGVIGPAAHANIRSSWLEVTKIVEREIPVYGINTGFGPLCNTHIPEEDTCTLQYNLLKSHSVGVGKPIPTEIAKLMLITKVHALAQGYSGISHNTIDRIIWHIDNNIIPVVPEKGSVGASGDLAPLAHLFLPLIGLGEVYHKGIRRPSLQVLNEYGLPPVLLGPKEGLALINGTQFILAFAVQGVQRLHYCLEAADIIGAMSLEDITGTKAPFDERLHRLRPFKGNLLVAQRLRLLLQESAIMQSHIDCGRV